MAVDLPSGEGQGGIDDSNAGKQPDRHAWPEHQAGRRGLAEVRGRDEYYESLRAAVGWSAATRYPGEAADTRAGRSGWDAADAGKRPSLDALRISAERAAHILDGDKTGGGHRHGTGSPGRTEFPAHWSDDTILHAIMAVARRPEAVRQQWNDRWKARADIGGVTVTAIINPDGAIWTAWPEEGSPGVVRNPEKGAT